MKRFTKITSPLYSYCTAKPRPSTASTFLTHFTQIPPVCVKDSSRSQRHIPDHRQHVSAVASVCNVNFPALKSCIFWSGRWPQVHIPTRCFHRLEFVSCLFFTRPEVEPNWEPLKGRCHGVWFPADVGTFPMLVVVHRSFGLFQACVSDIQTSSASRARDSSSARSSCQQGERWCNTLDLLSQPLGPHTLFASSATNKTWTLHTRKCFPDRPAQSRVSAGLIKSELTLTQIRPKVGVESLLSHGIKCCMRCKKYRSCSVFLFCFPILICKHP